MADRQARLRIVAETKELATGALNLLRRVLGDKLTIDRPPDLGRKGEWLIYGTLRLGAPPTRWTFPERPGELDEQALEALTTQIEYLRATALDLGDATYQAQWGAPVVIAKDYPKERQRFLEALAPIIRDLHLSDEEYDKYLPR